MRISYWSSDVCSSYLLSVREEPVVAPFPRRACAAALSERRGTLHRVQAVLSCVPGAGDYDRGRAARGWLAPHDALRHRYDQVHLLRLLPGSMPGRCGGRGAELRIRDRNARGAALRSEEHTPELQSLMRISYAVFCLKKKHTDTRPTQHTHKHKS